MRKLRSKSGWHGTRICRKKSNWRKRCAVGCRRRPGSGSTRSRIRNHHAGGASAGYCCSRAMPPRHHLYLASWLLSLRCKIFPAIPNSDSMHQHARSSCLLSSREVRVATVRRFPSVPGAVTLLLVDVPYLDRQYDVIVRDNGNEVVWQQNGLSAGYLDAVAVGIPGGAVPHGDYTLFHIVNRGRFQPGHLFQIYRSGVNSDSTDIRWPIHQELRCGNMIGQHCRVEK